MNEYALVTGASQGIGKYIAEILAKKGYNLLLVSRSKDVLLSFKEELEIDHHISVEVYALDLSLSDSPVLIKQWIDELEVPISVLVNNAGFGLWGRFEELSLAEQQQMIALNIGALTALTAYLLPKLKQQKEAYILQVASTAAYQSVPSLAVYAASKAYVLSFTRAIRQELKKHRVYVSCLSPGPVATGFANRAGMQALSHLTEKYNMKPAVVAEEAVKGLFERKAEIVPGAMNKLQLIGVKFFPKILVERIAANLYDK
ncbi:SDR family oxidoreductase [Olivibacter sp. SDN3]|uniref:SDR family NAD(P)-dependent oxidoreductase n=1 Tax=Olivibacter sp. SDN3 TaxID=2764720 RepID=UPI0016512EF5|nr:SDR family oxidoreductase [Olivibacter sp. SDN3]QNL50196.1 SDR family oxidoreductase [Olivibacter sp. SDN3]